jgi:hypothetical protein
MLINQNKLLPDGCALMNQHGEISSVSKFGDAKIFSAQHNKWRSKI